MIMDTNDEIHCKICNKKMRSIGWRHLKSHNTTVEEYKQKFPDAPLASKNTLLKRAEAGKKRNESRKGKPRSQEVIQKIKQTKKSNPIVPWNKGIPKTEEEKKRLSEKLKQLYANGDIIPHNLGIPCSEEQKKKISRTAKSQNRTISEEQKEKTKQTLERKKSEGWVHPSSYRKGTKVTDPVILQKLKEANKRTNLKKAETANKEIIDTCNSNGLTVLDIDLGVVGSITLSCNKCNSKFTYTKQIFKPSKKNGKEICPVCFPRNTGSSQKEQSLYEKISEVYTGRIVQNDRLVLNGKELDIYFPNEQLAIEFNGLFWHRETYYRGHPLHLNHKRQFAYKRGVQLIHIFEDEWDNNPDLVISRIKQKLKIQTNKIYARQCVIKPIDAKTKDKFLDNYHIMGKDVSGIRYGAFYNDELVGVMTFKPTSYVKGGKGNSIELNRFAVKINHSIVGLPSKMFKHFINEHNPQTVITYCDLRWNTGDSYQKMGFVFDSITPPSFWYIDPSYKTRVHRSQFMKHKIITEETKHLTGWEIMQERGYDRIWDCGHAKYIWKRENQ